MTPRKPRRRRVDLHAIETPLDPAALELPAMPDDPAAEWALGDPARVTRWAWQGKARA